jgi:hypothetical protein
MCVLYRAYLSLFHFCSTSDNMVLDPWSLWSYCVILLLGATCYFLSGWFRSVCFVLQLSGPPAVPLLGNALLVTNHEREFYWPILLYVYNTPAGAWSGSFVAQFQAHVTLCEPTVAASVLQCDYSDSCLCTCALMRFIAQGWRKLARRLTRSMVRCSVCGLQWYQAFSCWRQRTYR